MTVKLTDDELDQLKRNSAAGCPVIKLQVTLDNQPLRQKFLLTQMDEDGLCRGVCDYGIGDPCEGYVSIDRLHAFFEGEHPLTVQKVEGFKTNFTTAQWLAASLRLHGIPDSEEAVRRITRPQEP